MNTRLASYIIRLGIAIALFYAAISSLMYPDNWIGFIPIWLIPANLSYIFLVIFSIIQIIVGLWLLSNYMIKYAVVVVTVILTAIIFTNLSSMDLLFRDIPILFSAIALLFIKEK